MKHTALRSRLADILAQDVAALIVKRVEAERADLDAAARGVVEAVDYLQQAKHTMIEPGARRTLEKRALKLRAILRARDGLS